jgi:hypothetical protein
MRVIAEEAARVAKKHWSHYPLGSFQMDLGGPNSTLMVTVLYDHTLHTAGPEYRERQLCRFRERLRQAGYHELAYATYPPAGEDGAGSTFAMVIDAWPPAAACVCETWSQYSAASDRAAMEVKALYQQEVERTRSEMLSE